MEAKKICQIIEEKRADIYRLYEENSYMDKILEKSRELDEILTIYNKMEEKKEK